LNYLLPNSSFEGKEKKRKMMLLVKGDQIKRPGKKGGSMAGRTISWVERGLSALQQAKPNRTECGQEHEPWRSHVKKTSRNVVGGVFF